MNWCVECGDDLATIFEEYRYAHRDGTVEGPLCLDCVRFVARMAEADDEQ